MAHQDGSPLGCAHREGVPLIGWGEQKLGAALSVLVEVIAAVAACRVRHGDGDLHRRAGGHDLRLQSRSDPGGVADVFAVRVEETDSWPALCLAGRVSDVGQWYAKYFEQAIRQVVGGSGAETAGTTRGGGRLRRC